MCDILTFIGIEAAKTIVVLATTSIAGGVIWLGTLKIRSNRLQTLVSNPARKFTLYYRGSEDVGKNKTITFNIDGTIGEGSNSNENRWNISYGTLKILTNNNVKFSVFRWNPEQAKLVHINDPSLPSVMGQYIVPSYIPAGAQIDIYEKL